jgi:phospholipid/cholesterol/gamma-HCH transport system substrate-binding protein
MKTELKVGIFAIIVIIILSYMTFKVSGLGVAWKKGYKLHVMFDNISGLDEKSRIKVAGVDAGIVAEVGLIEGKAKLTLLIKPDVKLYKDAKASLRVSGLLGDKYLALWAGTSDGESLKDGDWIQNTESAADIDALANELSSAASYISDLAEDLEDIFGDAEKEAIIETIHNFRSITGNVDEMIKENGEPLNKIIVRLDDFSKTLSDEGPGLINDLREAARGLKEIIDENRYALRDSMENIEKVSVSAGNIAQKLEEGEGTLGKLLNDDKLYDSFSGVAEGAGKSFKVVDELRTFMDFRSEYLSTEGDWKGYFDLTLQTRKDLYYILGVVSDPLGLTEITDRVINDTLIREEETKRKVEFSAQVAKRFEDFILRVGMLENTFGAGVDYYLLKDRGKVSLDAWDFSADEADAEKAHLKIGFDYRIFKHVFISSGIDNLLNSDRRGIYVGGGLRFEDEDLKYLLSLSPL